MPTGFSTNLSAGVSDGMIGTVESSSGRIGEPGVVVTSTVRSSTVSAANAMSPKYFTPTSQPNSGTLIRFEGEGDVGRVECAAVVEGDAVAELDPPGVVVDLRPLGGETRL